MNRFLVLPILFLAVLGLNSLVAPEHSFVQVLFTFLIPLSFIFFIGLFVKGSIRYAKEYRMEREFPDSLNFNDLSNKVDQFILNNEIIVISRQIDMNALFYELKVPISWYSWGNKMRIYASGNHLSIQAENPYIQWIDFNVTIKKLVEELLYQIETKANQATAA